MALESFHDSNNQLTIPSEILEALTSRSSLRTEEEHLNSILAMAQWDSRMVSDHVMNSQLGNSSTSGFAVMYDSDVAVSNLTLPNGASWHSHVSPCIEHYITQPSSPMSVRSDNSVTGLSVADAFANLRQSGQNERERKQVGQTKASTDLSKPKVRARQEISLGTPIPKKPRLDLNQERLQRHQIVQELLLKKFQDRNPQVNAMLTQKYREQNQLQLQTSNSAPQLRGFYIDPLTKQQIMNLLQDQGNQPRTFAPLLDSSICSRRLMQYLYHLRNIPHDSSIDHWKNFVSEYYAPGARKRWCFSNYGNIQSHSTGVFCPKAMETWCCEVCGSRSGKGLEAPFEVIPRLFKIKFESGMLDEILFLEVPRSSKISAGLVLEYQKVVQESVYENFRVLHEGKLRIVFRHDLKILSWEFCPLQHDELLLRRVIVPQVNDLVQAAAQFQNGNQNSAAKRVLPEDLQKKSKELVSAGNQLARTMELPLVNDLGYPKRFIRCLQISEVANSMKSLMDFSHDRNMGPIESLNNYFRAAVMGKQMKDKQEMEELFAAPPGFHRNGFQITERTSNSRNMGSTSVILNHQYLGQSSSIRPEGSKPHEHGRGPHQTLEDKFLHDMAAANRGKSVNNTFRMSNEETTRQPYQNTFTSLLNTPMQRRAPSNELRFGESSSAASRTTHFARAASNGNSSAGHNISIKPEPHSPEQLPDYYQYLSSMGDSEW